MADVMAVHRQLFDPRNRGGRPPRGRQATSQSLASRIEAVSRALEASKTEDELPPNHRDKPSSATPEKVNTENDINDELVEDEEDPSGKDVHAIPAEITAVSKTQAKSNNYDVGSGNPDNPSHDLNKEKKKSKDETKSGEGASEEMALDAANQGDNEGLNNRDKPPFSVSTPQDLTKTDKDTESSREREGKKSAVGLSAENINAKPTEGPTRPREQTLNKTEMYSANQDNHLLSTAAQSSSTKAVVLGEPIDKEASSPVDNAPQSSAPAASKTVNADLDSNSNISASVLAEGLATEEGSSGEARKNVEDLDITAQSMELRDALKVMDTVSDLRDKLSSSTTAEGFTTVGRKTREKNKNGEDSAAVTNRLPKKRNERSRALMFEYLGLSIVQEDHDGSSICKGTTVQMESAIAYKISLLRVLIMALGQELPGYFTFPSGDKLILQLQTTNEYGMVSTFSYNQLRHVTVQDLVDIHRVKPPLIQLRMNFTQIATDLSASRRIFSMLNQEAIAENHDRRIQQPSSNTMKPMSLVVQTIEEGCEGKDVRSTPAEDALAVPGAAPSAASAAGLLARTSSTASTLKTGHGSF